MKITFPPRLNITSLCTFLLAIRLSAAQVSSNPDTENEIFSEDDGLPPVLYRQGDTLLIPTADFMQWITSNRNTWMAINDEIIHFAETRTETCPVGVNSREAQSTFNSPPEGVRATTPFALGYLVYTFGGIVSNLQTYDFANTAGLQLQDQPVPEWLQEICKLFGWLPGQAREEMAKFLGIMKNSEAARRRNWDAYNAVNIEVYNDYHVFPQPAEFGNSEIEQLRMMLSLARWLCGGTLTFRNPIYAALNIRDYQKMVAQTRRELAVLRERVTEAENWMNFAKKWKLNTILLTEMSGYWRYFPAVERTDETHARQTTAVDLFSDIWSWYGCWVSGLEKIARLMDEITLAPGLVEGEIDKILEERPLTMGDTLTMAEVMGDVPPSSEAFAKYLASKLTEVERQEEAAIASSVEDHGQGDQNSQIQVQPQPQQNVANTNANLMPIYDPGVNLAGITQLQNEMRAAEGQFGRANSVASFGDRLQRDDV